MVLSPLCTSKKYFSYRCHWLAEVAAQLCSSNEYTGIMHNMHEQPKSSSVGLQMTAHSKNWSFDFGIRRRISLDPCTTTLHHTTLPVSVGVPHQPNATRNGPKSPVDTFRLWVPFAPGKQKATAAG